MMIASSLAMNSIFSRVADCCPCEHPHFISLSRTSHTFSLATHHPSHTFASHHPSLISSSHHPSWHHHAVCETKPGKGAGTDLGRLAAAEDEQHFAKAKEAEGLVGRAEREREPVKRKGRNQGRDVDLAEDLDAVRDPLLVAVLVRGVELAEQVEDDEDVDEPVGEQRRRVQDSIEGQEAHAHGHDHDVVDRAEPDQRAPAGERRPGRVERGADEGAVHNVAHAELLLADDLVDVLVVDGLAVVVLEPERAQELFDVPLRDPVPEVGAQPRQELRNLIHRHPPRRVADDVVPHALVHIERLIFKEAVGQAAVWRESDRRRDGKRCGKGRVRRERERARPDSKPEDV
eukprot:1431803-Rhodomonas_salina.1